MTSKGIMTLLASIGVGLLAGLGMSLILQANSTAHVFQDLILGDEKVVILPYLSDNLFGYLSSEAVKKRLIKGFVETGGPKDCGTIAFGDKQIAIWNTTGCNITDSANTSIAAAHLSRLEGNKFAGAWGVRISEGIGNFCLEVVHKLPWGQYRARLCRQTPLLNDVEMWYNKMKTAYTQENTCVTQTSYQVCWTDLDGYNFTYAKKIPSS